MTSVVVALPALAIAVMVALVIGSRGRRTGPAPSHLPAQVRRRTTVSRAVGAGAGLLLAAASIRFDALGRGFLLAAPLFGLGVLGGVLTGELAILAPAGPTRRAAVEIRRLRDYVPARLTAATAVATMVLAGVLAATTALGSPDDLGRPGRTIARACSPVIFESRGPWPGSFYSLPLALVLAAGTGATLLTLRRIVSRPRPGDPRELAGGDDLLRRSAAHAAIGAFGVLVTLPLIGVSLVAASALLSFGCRPALWSIAGWSLLALVPLWMVLLGANALAMLARQTTPTCSAVAR